MKSTEFCYWLQGYFELTLADMVLSADQVRVIRNHLALVFKHEIDPSYGEDAVEMQQIHDGKKPPKRPSWSPMQGGVIPAIGPDTLFRC